MLGGMLIEAVSGRLLATRSCHSQLERYVEIVPLANL